MTVDELNKATRGELEARRAELMRIPNVEKKYPENLELQLIRQMIETGYSPPIYKPLPTPNPEPPDVDDPNRPAHPENKGIAQKK